MSLYQSFSKLHIYPFPKRPLMKTKTYLWIAQSIVKYANTKGGTTYNTWPFDLRNVLKIAAWAAPPRGFWLFDERLYVMIPLCVRDPRLPHPPRYLVYKSVSAKGKGYADVEGFWTYTPCFGSGPPPPILICVCRLSDAYQIGPCVGAS